MVGGGSSVSFVWVPWIELAPQRQWRLPGRGWGPGPQQWHTTEFPSEWEWRSAWGELVGWGRRVSERYAAFERKRFLLRDQLARVSNGGPFSKSRILRAAWAAGAPVGGLPRPLVARRLPSPQKLIDHITSPARRSVAARFFTGDLDIAAYSGNWDLSRSGLPSRACAYCYYRWRMMPCIEDEWHVLFVCSLYDHLRRLLPFTRTQVLREGHELQGGGCTEHNLTSLVEHVLALPKVDPVIDFLLQALRLRKQARQRRLHLQ